MKKLWDIWKFMVKEPFIIAVLIACIISAGGLLFLRSSITAVDKAKATPVMADKINTKEAVLAKWVYNHSSKISQKTANNIVKEALKTSKPLLILAVCSVESEFNPTAISSAGAMGLGQIMWKYWGEDLKKANIAKDVRDLFDYDTNIQATSFILDKLLKEPNADIASALTKYLGANNSYYKNRITEALTNLYILTQ